MFQSTVANCKWFLGRHQLLILDETLAIPEIGKALKMMVDELEKLAITWNLY